MKLLKRDTDDLDFVLTRQRVLKIQRVYHLQYDAKYGVELTQSTMRILLTLSLCCTSLAAMATELK